MRLVDYVAVIGAIITIAATIASGKTYVDAKVDQHAQHQHDGAALSGDLKAICENQQVIIRFLAVEYGKESPELTCSVR